MRCFSFAVALMALLIAPLAHAEFKVLFLGNSFTIGSGGGGVPGIFDRLAQAGGQEDPTTVMQAVGGVDYQYHATDPAAQSAIASQPWTHVVLQNYSTQPTHIGSVAAHLTYGTILYQQVMSNSPQARVVLFETWSRAAAHALITGVSTPTTFASTDEFQAELRTNYYKLADVLNANYPGNPPAQVAPVGDAWQKGGGMLPESDPNFLDLHGSDNYHGNNNGYYLAAAVIYSQIYGVSPHGLSTNPLISGLNLGLTVSPTLLEDIAWETVRAAMQPKAQSFLFDFGASASTTGHGAAPSDPVNYWNNVTDAIGANPAGLLTNIVTTENTPTAVGLAIVSRFNGANTAGTTASSIFPSAATLDSLFGNTELFGGLSDIQPSFKLTGLNTGLTYWITFYASRTGVPDNRETRYTVQGGNSGTTVLNAANNIDTVSSSVSGITPTAAGEITISLAPTTNNNNANHFTYLGVMKVESIPPQQPITFTTQPVSQTVSAFQAVTFNAAVQGTPPYSVQWLSNGIPILGADQFAYTIPSVALDMDGSQFRVTVSNLLYGAISSNAVLRVRSDTNPPVLLSATSTDGLTVVLAFDERLDPATAAVASHYQINGGASLVTSAILQPDGQTVALTTVMALTGAFTVTVTGVKDISGNDIAPGTSIGGQVPDPLTESLLFDFGGANTTEHGPSPDDPTNYWNNVSTGIGTADNGRLANAVTVANTSTPIGLSMIRRFNGANENGTTASTLFPIDATRDTLYGNTELWNNLTGIFPSFKLTGLNQALTYNITFYASRTGASDNRETGFTVQGTNTAFVAFNPANNVNAFTNVLGIVPTAAGEITISLAPTANNNNSYHFTYLGVMRVTPVPPGARLLPPILKNDQVTLNWTGPGRLERAPTVVGPWTRITPQPAPPYSESFAPGENRFFRVNPNP